MVEQLINIDIPKIFGRVSDIKLLQNICHHVGFFEQPLFGKRVNDPQFLLHFFNRVNPSIANQHCINIFYIIKQFRKANKLFFISVDQLCFNFLIVQLLYRQFIPILAIYIAIIYIIPHIEVWLYLLAEPHKPRKHRQLLLQ